LTQLGYQDDQLVLYVAATASGTATLSDNTYIYAFAANSSTTSPSNRRTDLLWTWPATISAANSNLGEIVGAGAVHRNGTVCFGTAARGNPTFGGSNGVIALNGGKKVWQFETASGVTSNILAGGVFEEDGCCDFVYFVTGDGSSEATLYAVNVYTGVEEWSFTLTASEDIDSPPTSNFAFGLNADLIVPFGEKVYSIDRATGNQNWVEAVGSTDPFVAAPAIHKTEGGTEINIYLGNTGGRFYRLIVNEDNTGLDLSPTKKIKDNQLCEITRSMGQMYSSPVMFGGGQGVFQLDNAGLMVAWKMNGKELWRYNYNIEITDARQPAVTSKGEVLVAIANTITAIGGSGGCSAGFSTVDPSLVTKSNPNGFCDKCGSGNYSASVGSEVCERCVPGFWSDAEGAIFCYKCQEPEWCLGGNQCVEGNVGTMCASCQQGWYLLFKDCLECPENPFVYTLAVIGGVIFLMMLYMHFTRGTKFAYEVAKDDILAIYINNGTRCEQCAASVTCGLMGTTSKRVECKVTRVIDDYSLEVAGNFGNKRKIKDVPFWLIKCRVYGDEVRKQGSGRVTVAPTIAALDKETQARLREATAQGLLEEEGLDAGAGLDIKALLKKDVREELGLDTAGATAENRSIVHGKTQSAGVEVIMAASLIVVGYAQSSSLFVEIPVAWPYFFTRIFGLLGQYLTLDLTSMAISPDCQWYWSYERKWYTAMMMPIVLMSMLIMQYHVYEACVPHILIRKQMQNKVINTACIMMVLLYVFVTAKTIEPFDCTRWQDGTSTLNKDPSVSCQWTQKGGTEFTSYAGMAFLGILFFIFYGVGIPAALFSMLYTAKVNHTMGAVMTKEKFGWIYIRFTYEFYFWEIVIMFRKFLFVLVVLLTDTPKQTLSYLLAANLSAMLLQYYYRPFNCFDCLLSRSRRCTHWGAMDQLEVFLLAAQLVTLAVGMHIINNGAESVGPPEPGEPLSTPDLIMITAVGLAGLSAILVISYLYMKTYLLRNKMRNAGDKNEYQTAQNMQAINTDAADFFCGC